MPRMARSKSCHGTGGSSRRKLSPSPESHRKTHEKRGRRRSLDRKHGGVDSTVSKDEHVGLRGGRNRSRSKSPRRNSWREEIKHIKSWRDERVIRPNRFEIKRSSHSSKEDEESKRSMKCFKKNEKADKKFYASFRSNKSTQRDERLPNKSTRSPNKKMNKNGDSRSLSSRKARQSPLPDRRGGHSSSDRREDQSSRGKLGKKPSRWNDEELMQVTRKVDKTGLDLSKTQVKDKKAEYCSPSTREEKIVGERTSSADSADSDELELRISDKDVFPELRDDWTDRSSVDAGASADDKKVAQKKCDELASLVIKITPLKNDENSSKRSVKLIAGTDDTDEHVRPESIDSQSLFPQGRISYKSIVVSEPLTTSDGVGSSDAFSSTSSSSLSSEKESSAMSRSFSLLELKMEVYTTRLKELEWEREELRKERGVLQGQELCVKRELLTRLQKKEILSAKLENENKENRG